MSIRWTLPGLLALLAACGGGGGGNPSFQLALDPESPSLTAARGGSASLTLRLTPEGGFSGTVSLALEREDGSQAPAGLSLSPASLSVSGPSPITQPLTLSVGEAAPPGEHRLQLRATSGSLARTARFRLNVPAPGLRLGLPPGTFGLTRGLGGPVSLELAPEGGFRGEVELSLVGSVPPGLSLAPDRVTLAALTTLPLTLSTTSSTPTGLHRPRLRAAGGGVSAEAELSLFVAARGEPDPSFGSGGIRIFDIASASNTVRDLLWRNGGLVVGGHAQGSGGNSDFTLAAFTGSGDWLATETTDFGGQELLLDLAPQPNGSKFVAAGYTFSGSTFRIALARYNPDGSSLLDTSFNGDGKRTDLIGSQSAALAAAVDNSNRIVVAGYSVEGSNTELFLTRYLENGALDAGFGTGGQVRVPVGPSSYFLPLLVFGGLDLLLQPDGKLVVAGAKQVGSQTVLFLRRYGADGVPDASFGSGGEVTAVVGSATLATALLQQPDGRLVVAGNSYNGSDYDFVLLRRNPLDGSPDTSFGTGGQVVIPIGSGEDLSHALVRQPDGRLVVAGYAAAPGGSDFALARLNPDGTLDPSFGAGGKVTTPLAGEDQAFALLLQPDGRLVAAGGSRASGSNVDYALVRYW
ncbi:MAG: delta-60 repeat domain-containing protein [Meiothermus sp.]|uniref:delta-60 repeat domain-containing protein n=1 Tax=Meiothermus sp. TaxID=1955249 RepID=UPI00298F3767|nr:delta-60 repeat domain-containing protein [Meiothermus sp.]MDW8092019.1 delta-60 repeat domain-containing protein [Meiothermus sp.]